jgi:hypothetical protein
LTHFYSYYNLSIMNSIAELQERFSFAFSPEQANVLANVIYSSYNELVKTSDFKELKQVVSDLAEAQKRTEYRVDELAKAQEQTSREVRNLARQIGGLSESFGASLEDFALDLVPDLLEKYWNLKVIECSREEVKVDNKTIEFDIFIEGFINDKKIIVLGEVKSHITRDEVTKFYKLIDKVKPLYTDAEIRVVFFGYRAYKEVRELIRSLGGYMIFSNSKKL